MTEAQALAEPKGNMDTNHDNETITGSNTDITESTDHDNTASNGLANNAAEPLDTQDAPKTESLETTEVLFSSDEAGGQPSDLQLAAEQLVQEKQKELDAGSIKSPPPPLSPSEDSSSAVPTAKRKLFGWLSRNSSNDSGVKSPPSQPRRGTLTSLFSSESITESSAAKLPGENADTETMARRIHRNSLKDRFKFVRMREEAGIVALEDQDGSVVSPSQSRPQSVQETSILVMADSDAAQDKLQHPQSSSSRPTSPQGQPVLNDSLPPGSAIGTSTGPSSSGNEAVDWDLWQEVVYEGPAAVARTSPDQLSLAIRHGIPSAIRGVVWQVLAQSKNEDLEQVYKDLVARGRNLEVRPHSLSRGSSRTRPDSSDVVSPVESTREKEVPEEEQNDEAQKSENDALSISEKDLPEPAPLPLPVVSEIQPSSQPPSQLEPSSRNDTPLASPGVSRDPALLDNLARIQTEPPSSEEKRRKDEIVSLQKLERAIKRDLGTRTSFSKFLMSSGLQDGLFGICKAYALFDEEVGYAQGMNFIAMPLLFNMPEEEAFCLFVRLMNQYRLRDLFIHDMPGLHLHLYQFERLLEDFEPALYCHLHRRGVQPQLYATQWFLTLFAYRFPLQLVLRIYDLILSEGLESAILKFGLVLMQRNAKALLDMKDMSALTNFLKDRLFDVYIDKSPSASSLLESGFFGSAGGIDKEVYRADALVEDACAISLTPEMLRLYTKEWEEKVQDEKEKAAELENLRTQNTQLTAQVRQMTQRAETQDQEHVSLASDLVHTKIANQTLQDENESLTTRIAELQTIIDAQPGEVEERLRAEMERIMTRNAEVQHENRALEEQCSEMEGELANAKMRVAEMDGELENMRSRWRSMEGAMSGMTKGFAFGPGSS